MIPALLTGGIAGLGLLLAVLLVRPSRVSVAAQLLRLDAERVASVRAPVATSIAEDSLSQLRTVIGARAAALWRSRGWGGDKLRADLAILGRSLDGYLATKLLLAFGGLLLPPVVISALSLVGRPPSLLIPFWASVLLALIGFVLPDAALRGEAARRRSAFQHAVGAFLDLVSMNLAGGRGVPEALLAAATVGQGWAFRRLREVLSTARLAGLTPWAALGHLGEEIAVDELRDLAAALALVAEDGAKVRQSLSARAASMRRKEMTEAEGAANENSQSMLVAQMLLCAAFLLFLLYPAVITIFRS